MLIETNGEEMADGGDFALSMNRKSGAGSGEQQRLHPQKLGRQRGLCLLTAAHMPLVGGVTQAVSGLVDVHVLVSLMPEVAGEYTGWAGAGIWVLMARRGAGLCRGVYTTRTVIKPIPVSNHHSLGAGRVCCVPTWAQRAQPITRRVWASLHPPCRDGSTASSRGSIPWCKTKQTGGVGRWCCRNWGSDRELLGWALDQWEMAISSSWDITRVSGPTVCGQDESKGGIRAERR